MKTIVKNVSTDEKMIFVNNLSLVDNMVNAIFQVEKKAGDLLNDSLRKKIIVENNLVERASKKPGRTFVYCEKYDLYAYAEK
jgi:hypothetical protein